MDTNDNTHECPYPECDERLPPHLLACSPHWRIVPGPLKYRVNDAYRSGRHAEYVDVREQAVAAMERHHARSHGRARR